MPGTDLVLSTYLNDHHAVAIVTAELARRVATQHRRDAAAADFTELAAELVDDRRALREVLVTLEVPVRRYKAVAAWVGEKLGRCKLNGRVLSRSPASPVVELEGLAMLLTARVAGWRSLLTLARHDGRLDERELIELSGRAERQLATVHTLQARYAEAAFASGTAG